MSVRKTYKERLLFTSMKHPLLDKAIKHDASEFALMTSLHCFPYRFDGDDPAQPTLTPVKFTEAYREGNTWVIESEFYGGMAQVYHIPSRTIYPL